MSDTTSNTKESATDHGRIMDAANCALNELLRATRLHGPMRGTHEGYAVILEEVDELWDEVKKKHPDKAMLREEAIQVAAMALRFVVDVC